MKIKTLCLLALLLFVIPILGDAQGQDRMHGMAVIISQEGNVYILPGSAGFMPDGLDFRIYNWPAAVPISTGQQDVMILYAGIPMFGAGFLGNGVLIGIIPSAETWRETCRFLDGFVRYQPRQIEVSDSGDLRTIYLRNPPKQ